MFKKKNQTNLLIIISLLKNNPISIFTNNGLSDNLILISSLKKSIMGPFYLLSELERISAIDIVCFLNNKRNSVVINNVWYSYKWDLYFSDINTVHVNNSLSLFFYNRLWLEREASELFNVHYNNIVDSRPLLLNYGDNIGFLLKNTTTQPIYELRTVWHERKINKNNNNNVEL